MSPEQSPEEELAQYKAEVSRLNAKVLQLRMESSAIQQEVQWAKTTAKLVIATHTAKQQGQPVEEFAADFLNTIREQLFAKRTVFYRRIGGRLEVLYARREDKEAVIEIPSAQIPEFAYSNSSEASDPAFIKLISQATGLSFHLWSYLPDEKTGILVSNDTENLNLRGGYEERHQDFIHSTLEVFLDVIRRQRHEVAMRHRVHLTESLNRISGEFINIPRADLNQVITSALGDIVESMKATTGLLEIFPTQQAGVQEAFYRWPFVTELRTSVLQNYPKICTRLRDKETVIMIAGIVTSENLLETTGMGSAIFVPLVYNNQTVGSIGLLFQTDNPDLPAEDRTFLSTVATVFSNALAVRWSEDQRNLLETQVQQTQKLESLGVLIGGIAHDFNNLLTPIMGNSELAMEIVGEEAKTFKYFDEIYRAGERARKLVQQILAFSRRGNVHLDQVEIEPVLNEVLALIRASVPTTIQLTPVINLNEAHVEGNATQLLQVLMNLCTNGYQAIGDQKGELRITVNQGEISPTALQNLPKLHRGEYVHIQVSDTGSGIPLDIQDRIFDPFFTTKALGEGTGMGLAMVHGIVDKHHGGIYFESSASGTIFHVYLPLSGKSTQRIHPELPAATQSSGEHIMVVDDEAQVSTLIQNIFEHLEYKVSAYSDSVLALEAFKRNPERFDVVITDYTMPNMTGLELAQQLHTLRPELPILMLTGYSEQPMNEQQRAEAGIRGVLNKPIRRGELVQEVKVALEGLDIKLDGLDPSLDPSTDLGLAE